MENIKYWIWFSIFNFRQKDKIDILNIFDNKPENIWNSTKEELFCKLNQLSFSKKKIEKILIDIISNKNNINLEKLENDLKDKNIKVITFLDNKYPKELLHIYDYPILLYVKGNNRRKNPKGRSPPLGGQILRRRNFR